MTKNLGKVISVYSGKGGCAKTFLSSYLPIGISKHEPDAKILIIDLCKNGHIAEQFGGANRVEKGVYEWYTSRGTELKDSVYRFGNSNIYYMPSTSKVDKIVEWTEQNIRLNREYYFRKLVDNLKPHFDYIFIDNHPSQNDDKGLYSIVAADTVIISTTAELGTMLETVKDINYIKEIQEELNHDLKFLVSTNKVETTKGDVTFVEEFQRKVKEELDVKDEQFLSFIRYSSPVKKFRLHKIFGDTKIKSNKYVVNVLEDVFKQSEEVIDYVK